MSSSPAPQGQAPLRRRLCPPQTISDHPLRLAVGQPRSHRRLEQRVRGDCQDDLAAGDEIADSSGPGERGHVSGAHAGAGDPVALLGEDPKGYVLG